MHVFRHPKYYTELRKRNTEAVAKSGKSHASLESDQAISKEPATAGNQRAPGPGLKQQAPSSKRQASSFRTNLSKHQATSVKPQAASVKLKPTSVKLQDS